MNKKQVEDLLKAESEKIKTPENLSTEKMMEKLEGVSVDKKDKVKKQALEREGVMADGFIIEKTIEIKRHRRSVIQATAIAVCLILIALCINKNQTQQYNKPVVGEEADNYRQIYNKLCSIQNTNNDGGFYSNFWNSLLGNKNGYSTSTDVAIAESTESSTADYSDTNVRQDGVGEGDKIKIDGRYIYILEDGHTDYNYGYYEDYVIDGVTTDDSTVEENTEDTTSETIVENHASAETTIEEDTEDVTDGKTVKNDASAETEDLDVEGNNASAETDDLDVEENNENDYDRIKIVTTIGDEPKVISEINLSEIVPEDAISYSFEEMYVVDKKIVVLCNVDLIDKDEDSDSTNDVYDYSWENTYSQTYIYTFDISDRVNPKLKGTAYQDGSYMSSRLIGEYVYTFSYDYLYEFDEENCVPKVNGSYMQSQKVYIPEYVDSTSYIVMTAVNLSKPKKIADSKTILSGYSDFYVSNNHIYILEESYDETEEDGIYTDSENAHLIKVSYKKGKLKVKGETVLEGYINDSMSIDEAEDGNVRVLTTVDKYSYNNENANYETVDSVKENRLYVLDSNLEVLGEIDGISPDEDIYSAKYVGDICYFVTYENTDPLIVADLSDPENPTILGEAVITGFSSYLYSWSDNLLLGIGEETDGETGEFLGCKLSMFDVSDPLNPTEVSRIVYKTKADYVDFNTEYKSLLLDPEKNLIGITSEEDFYGDEYAFRIAYNIYSYTENGFESVLKDVVISKEESREDFINYNSYNIFRDIRGVYIKDKLYVITPLMGITTYSLEDFSKLSEISLEVKNEVESESEAESESQSEAETEAESEIESQSETEIETESEAATEVVTE